MYFFFIYYTLQNKLFKLYELIPFLYIKFASLKYRYKIKNHHKR